MAIKEEQAKVAGREDKPLPFPTGDAEKRSEPRESEIPDEGPSDELRKLRQEHLDMTITNRAKDMFIEQLREEREGFGIERQTYVEKLMSFNRRVGELETSLRQLSAGDAGLPRISEGGFGDADGRHEASVEQIPPPDHPTSYSGLGSQE